MRFLKAILVVAGLSISTIALAANPADEFRLDKLPPATDEPINADVVTSPFAKGTKAVTTWISYTPPIRYSSDHVYQASAGIGYYLWNNHSVNVIFHGFSVDQLDDNTAQGTGISFLGRYHFFNEDRWTCYFDGGVGYTWWNSAVPEGGTTYNFNPRVGLGVGYEIDRNVWLTSGARYFHISNARAHGGEKNPGYDGIECYIGLILTFN